MTPSNNSSDQPDQPPQPASPRRCHRCGVPIRGLARTVHGHPYHPRCAARLLADRIVTK